MSSVRPTGPNDPTPIGNLGGAKGAEEVRSAPGAFKLSPKQAAASTPEVGATAVDPIVRRIKERIASGGDGAEALNEIVESEITASTGKPAPKAMVTWVSDSIREDPEMSRILARLTREAQS
ncbi:MAG: hypothetical protein ACOYN0_17755 [Phycisphaerales bacterium]